MMGDPAELKVPSSDLMTRAEGRGLVRKELEADPGRRETTPQGVPLAQRPCPPEPASGLEAELGNGGITSVTYLEVLRGVRP